MNDWHEFRRISHELEGVEKVIDGKVQDEDGLKNDLRLEKSKESRLEQDQVDLRQILDVSRRLADEAGKIARKMDQVVAMRRKLSLSAPSAGGRDLRTLELELTQKMQAKDDLSAYVSRLNKELSALHDKVNQSSQLVVENEKKLREMEEKFVKEQEMNERRITLTEGLSKLQSEEARVRFHNTVCNVFHEMP